jgi:HlyD family secretion protein
VPQDQPLLVSVRVSAGDVDQVRLGQEVTLRFPTFNQRTTPEVSGVAISVSADALIDERTAAAYYEVEVAPEIEEMASVDLVPGMPAEAYLRTDLRTPLSYLIKPLADYFNRALREK